MNISVIVASRHGSTLEVGQFITDRLRSHGHEAGCSETGESEEPPAGDAVVLGSPLYMGRWLKSARRLAERLGASEEERPIFVFTCGPVGDPPKPEPPSPEQLFPALASKALKPTVFSGRLDLGALSRRERMIVRAAKSPEGDFRDFAAIGAFADEISTAL